MSFTNNRVGADYFLETYQNSGQSKRDSFIRLSRSPIGIDFPISLAVTRGRGQLFYNNNAAENEVFTVNFIFSDSSFFFTITKKIGQSVANTIETLVSTINAHPIVGKRIKLFIESGIELTVKGLLYSTETWPSDIEVDGTNMISYFENYPTSRAITTQDPVSTLLYKLPTFNATVDADMKDERYYSQIEDAERLVIQTQTLPQDAAENFSALFDLSEQIDARMPNYNDDLTQLNFSVVNTNRVFKVDVINRSATDVANRSMYPLVVHYGRWPSEYVDEDTYFRTLGWRYLEDFQEAQVLPLSFYWNSKAVDRRQEEPVSKTIAFSDKEIQTILFAPPGFGEGATPKNLLMVQATGYFTDGSTNVRRFTAPGSTIFGGLANVDFSYSRVEAAFKSWATNNNTTLLYVDWTVYLSDSNQFPHLQITKNMTYYYVDQVCSEIEQEVQLIYVNQLGGVETLTMIASGEIEKEISKQLYLKNQYSVFDQNTVITDLESDVTRFTMRKKINNYDMFRQVSGLLSSEDVRILDKNSNEQIFIEVDQNTVTFDPDSDDNEVNITFKYKNDR